MILTSKMTKLLFDVTEHHLKWYDRFYPHPPEFEKLLQVNHNKIVNKFKGLDPNPDEVIAELLKLKERYVNMLLDTRHANSDVKKLPNKKGNIGNNNTD